MTQFGVRPLFSGPLARKLEEAERRRAKSPCDPGLTPRQRRMRETRLDLQEAAEAARKAVAPETHNHFWRKIALIVCRSYGVGMGDLQGVNRKLRPSAARAAAYYFIASETKLSLWKIAVAMGRVNHSTVFHGIRRHAERHGLPLPRGMLPEGQGRGPR